MTVCKMAVETCFWPLFEVENGVWKLSYRPKNKLPIEEFPEAPGPVQTPVQTRQRSSDRRDPEGC